MWKYKVRLTELKRGCYSKGRGAFFTKEKGNLSKQEGNLSDFNGAIIRGEGSAYQKWKGALLVP